MANESFIPSSIVEAVSLISPVIINIFSAVIILLIGFVIGKIAEKLLLKIFELVELDKIASKRVKIKNLSKIISALASYAVYIVALIMALDKLALTTTIITTAVTILVFGINDILSNFFAGFAVRLRHNISVGDGIRIKDKRRDIKGKVEKVTSLNIQIDTGKDEIVIIPNSLLLRSEVRKLKN